MNLSDVTRNQREAIEPYISRGVKISQSAHHRDMFIFTFPDGGFFTVSSTREVILMTHPRDSDQTFIEKGPFKFNHTSNYKPTRMTVEQMKRRVMSQRPHGKN